MGLVGSGNLEETRLARSRRNDDAGKGRRWGEGSAVLLWWSVLLCRSGRVCEYRELLLYELHFTSII